MTPRSAAVVGALLAISLGVGIRAYTVSSRGFGPQDLSWYEQQSFGIDLPDAYGQHPFFLTWSRGDGQAFLTIAADPLARGPGRGLPNPGYRYARIGYPIAARAVVGGRIELLPIGLFTVNLLALGGLGAIAGWKHIAWGPRAMLLPLNPATLIGVAGDTAEPFALLAAATAVVATRRPAAGVAGLVLGLTRPSYATAIPLSRSPVLTTGGAILAALVLQGMITSGYALEFLGDAGNLTWPMVGYVTAWGDQSLGARLLASLVVVVAVLAIMQGARHRRWADRIAFISTGLLALSVSAVVIDQPVNLLRGVGMLPFVFAVRQRIHRPTQDPVSVDEV